VRRAFLPSALVVAEQEVVVTEDRQAVRRCLDPKNILLALLLMPYAIVRYSFDCWRGRP
jgi:hypothetical protein